MSTIKPGVRFSTLFDVGVLSAVDRQWHTGRVSHEMLRPKGRRRLTARRVVYRDSFVSSLWLDPIQSSDLHSGVTVQCLPAVEREGKILTGYGSIYRLAYNRTQCKVR